jgi:hypothetical protein
MEDFLEDASEFIENDAVGFFAISAVFLSELSGDKLEPLSAQRIR